MGATTGRFQSAVPNEEEALPQKMPDYVLENDSKTKIVKTGRLRFKDQRAYYVITKTFDGRYTDFEATIKYHAHLICASGSSLERVLSDMEERVRKKFPLFSVKRRSVIFLGR